MNALSYAEATRTQLEVSEKYPQLSQRLQQNGSRRGRSAAVNQLTSSFWLRMHGCSDFSSLIMFFHTISSVCRVVSVSNTRPMLALTCQAGDKDNTAPRQAAKAGACKNRVTQDFYFIFYAAHVVEERRPR